MFIGHFGLAFAAKKVTPHIPLVALMMAAQLLDLMWPIFLLTGVESVKIAPGDTAFTPLNFVDYPMSHSLLTTIMWTILFVGVFILGMKTVRGVWILGLLVMSHWALDWLTHRPDLPLYPGGDSYYGLGLWNSVWGTVAVEVPLFLVGVWLYWKATFSTSSKGDTLWWVLVAFLGLIYVGNIVGPAPPSEGAVAWVSLGMWLLVAWGGWIEKHRRSRTAVSPIIGGSV